MSGLEERKGSLEEYSRIFLPGFEKKMKRSSLGKGQVGEDAVERQMQTVECDNKDDNQIIANIH